MLNPQPLLFIVLLDVIEQADTGGAAAATDNTDINAADGEITEQVNKEMEDCVRDCGDAIL